MSLKPVFLLLCALFLVTTVDTPAQTLEVSSPDKKITVIFSLKEGTPFYQIKRDNKNIINASKLGFTLNEAPAINSDFKLASHSTSSFNETWTQPWGEEKEINSHYNELKVELSETGEQPRQLTIVFRAFDDGVGFRYEFPQQPHLDYFEIMDEETEFALDGDHHTWWIGAYQPNRFEYLYQKNPLSQLDSVQTPLTMETADGLYVSIHEAALTDYAMMALVRSENTTLTCDLYPWSDGTKVKAYAPHQTPWRTIQIAENPGDLITSYLMLNLNEPNKLEDISWIEPGKYVGIWWGMHLEKYTWSSGPKHGATTENTKRYIDFAAEHGFDGVLVEGWNRGWDGDWYQNSDLFNFTTPYPDYDIQELVAYADKKGVGLIGHHETSAGVLNYESQLEDAFKYLNELGIHRLKTGYVGNGRTIKRIDENGDEQFEWHYGQFMVRHYRKVVKTAATYEVLLDVHEPIKATGIRRTYPNMMTREGARGQEYNAWAEDGGNPPDHTAIIPFTRCLAGPFDHTPGIFDLTFDEYKPNNRVNTTLAKQLALYVVIFSPMHMAADLPENYGGHPALQFIEDVPVDWHTTKVLHAKIGDYVTIVRKDRNSGDWYLGSITDENARTLKASLDFLSPEQKYVAEIYADAGDADWQSNPHAYEIKTQLVDAETQMQLKLAAGGGQAIRFTPATEEDVKKFD